MVFLKTRTKEVFSLEYIQLFKLHCILFSWSKPSAVKAERLDLASKGRFCHITCVENVKWQQKWIMDFFFFWSVSDIPRAENAKSPSSVKLEYCYYKLIIYHLCEAFSLKKKKVEICYTRKLACSIKHGKFLFWLNLKWTESSCLSHGPLNLQSHLIKNPQQVLPLLLQTHISNEIDRHQFTM